MADRAVWTSRSCCVGLRPAVPSCRSPVCFLHNAPTFTLLPSELVRLGLSQSTVDLVVEKVNHITERAARRWVSRAVVMLQCPEPRHERLSDAQLFFPTSTVQSYLFVGHALAGVALGRDDLLASLLVTD